MKTYLLLDNIRSVYNVGSIFRTADAAGVDKLYLAGITPTPVDRFGRKRSDLSKVALGAEESVIWEHIPSARACVHALKQEGVSIVAVEQNDTSIDFRDFQQVGDTLFVLGSEREGISKDILKESDVIVEVPMSGKKESLNVSVTAGIVLFCGR